MGKVFKAMLLYYTGCKKGVVLYLDVCVWVSLAYYSSDRGEGELVPELLHPPQGPGCVQQDQSLGVVLLFTRQNSQTEQTPSHCFLVSKLLITFRKSCKGGEN